MAKHRNSIVVTLHKRRALLVGCAGVAMSFYSGLAQANPDGPDVVGGNIGINGLGTSQVDIVQSTSRGAINWNSFSIGNGETTRFIQPDSNSITLNRVTGADPSHILGTMTANGKIVLINGNGILFGPDSKVDAAGLVATTHDVDTDAFMAGAPLHFFTGAHELPNASVVNEGQITIHDAGVAAFVAPSVRNSGLIQADMGRIAMGAGKGFTLDLYGDDLISFQVNDNISSTLTAADGTPLRALVENDGLIRAAGGKIVLTAATAREVVNQAVHVSGTVSASSVSQKGGDIILGGGNSGIVNVENAHIGARGKTGGSVKILGDQVNVTASTIDASGDLGGGTIRIGGGDHGGEGLQSARSVSFDADSVAMVDALLDGDGGSVVLWSDNGTDFAGAISARGEGDGQGGYAEVSSLGLLAFHGTADLRAASGGAGTLLLDPENITISNSATTLLTCSAGACTASGDNSILNVTDLINALSTSNVVVSTGSTGAQAGTITVANNISWSNGNLLTLSAASSITINAGVTISNTYNGTYAAGRIPVVLALRADNAGANNSSGVVNNGTINMSGSSGAVALYYDNGATYTPGTQTANGSWAAPADGSLSTQFTAYRLVNTVTDLAAIGTNATTLGYTYALGKSITGSGTFNSNVPLGAFTGILDGGYGKLIGGSNYTVTGLTLAPAANTANVGLFGSISSTGIVRNLGLGLSVTATGSSTTATYVGTLAGKNDGLIANVTTSGTAGYTYSGSGSTGNTTYLGGLVGQNNAGSIVNSTASGNVTFTQSGTFTSTGTANIGGLAGHNNSAVTTSIKGSGASGTVAAQYGTGTAKTTVNIGGVVGMMATATTLSGLSYTGTTVSSSLQNGVLSIGGVVGNASVSGANIIGSTSSGAVNFTGAGSSVANMGGVVGNALGDITDSSSSAVVTYSGTGSGVIAIGGLAGAATGTITTSNASGTAQYTGSGTGGGSVGGLAGTSSGTITNSYSTAISTFAATSTGAGAVGGLVGTNSGTIQGTGALYSYSTGAVSFGANIGSASNLGGLVGNNSGTIKQAYSTGLAISVTSPLGNNIGGLVGTNSGTVGDSAASSATTYTSNSVTNTATQSGSSAPTVTQGGLIGTNTGSVFNAGATGDVAYWYSGTSTGTSKSYIGGLIGYNNSAIATSVTNASYAGNVSAKYTTGFSGTVTQYIGGLIGLFSNTSEITNTASSGTVADDLNGGSASEYAGGLVGYLNNAAAYITNSHSSSGVSYTGAGGPSVGGLVGYSKGIIRSGSYATGSVSVDANATTSVFIGGLVGQQTSTGSILNSYSDNGTITYTDALTANMGGLIGSNAGSIGDSAASSATTYSNTKIVMNANPTGTTANTYSIGGLSGINSGTIVNAQANGDVTFNYAGSSSGTTTLNLGGLVGSNSSTSATSITSSTATGAVLAKLDAAATGAKTINAYIGGLEGQASGAAGVISGVSATGSVTAILSAGTHYVGGLAGYVNSATAGITNSFATGDVSYTGLGTAAAIGGLAGYNKGIIQGTASSYSYATGNVTVDTTTGSGSNVTVGGLVGTNIKTVLQSYSQNGLVKYTGGQTTVYAGGLIGQSTTGTVGDSAATTPTTYSTENVQIYAAPTGAIAQVVYAGGLIGQLGNNGAGSLINGNASGSILYTYQGTSTGVGTAGLGGLVGQLYSTTTASIQQSAAQGSVSALYAASFSGNVTGYAGGLIGLISTASTPQTSWASGAVNSGLTAATAQYLGGLVGYNNTTATITNDYAVGSVNYTGTGTYSEGGLVGNNKGTVSLSYSTGYVMNTGATAGGLVGTNTGTVTSSYWDTGTSGQSASAAGTGITTTALQSALQGSFSATTWGIVAGETNPYLKWQITSGTPQSISGFAYSDLGTTVLANAAVGALSGGVAVSSILTGSSVMTGANGYYYFLVAPGTLPATNGKIMTYLTGATKANAVIDNANKASGSVTGLNLYATYLHEYSASTTYSGMTGALGTALGGNTGSNFLYTFAVGAPTLKAGANLAIDATGASLSIDQAINANGATVYLKNGGSITQNQAITADALALAGVGASYTLTNSGNSIGKVSANTGSVNLTDSTALNVGSAGGMSGIATTGATQLNAGGVVTLTNGIAAGGSGNNILISGAGFINNAGASALTTGSGYFRVWSGAPGSDNRGGIAYNYKQYNASYGITSVLGTGNGFLYSTAPVLTDTLGNITKVYDGNANVNFTGVTQTVGGAIDGDTVTLSLSGASATYSDKNAGTGKTVGSISGIAITSTTNGAATVYGYQLSQPSSASGDITQASLSITSATANNKIYDGTTTTTMGGTTALSGKVSGDTVNLVTAGAVGIFVDKNVGNNKAVTASGYTLSGADAGNYILSQPTGLTANITPAALTLAGLSASNKVYDATMAATLTGTATLSGKVAGDTVTLGGAGSATFADKNVGTGKAVSVSGYTISGTDAGNYTFSQPTGLTANITSAALTLAGLSASNKVYDATTTATLTGTATLSGKVAGDTVTLGGAGSATFADKNVGAGKAVTVSGYTISGADAANYTFSQPTGLTANITPAALTLAGLSASNKVYDATTIAALTGTATLSGKIAGDTVTLGGAGAGAFTDKNVGTSKAVTVSGYTISGADAGNYAFSQPTGLSANITAASLSIAGLSATNKVYDATTVAGLSGTAVLSGKLAGDTVTLGGTGTGAFADKNVGIGKSVTVTGYTISGADAENYILSQPTGLSANITAASLSVAGLSAANKIYNATTVAGLNGTATLSGKLAGDAVTLGGAGAGAFADKNVGTAKAVTVSGYTISGADAANYILTQPTGLSANITAATLSVTGLGASNKVYDSTTTATLTGTAALSGKMAGDTVTLGGAGAGNFADKNVGSNKAITVSGYTIGGADAGNYTLGQPTGLSANITAASLLVTGLGAGNKVYDSTTIVALSGTAALSGKYAGDTVTLGGAGTGNFADKNVGSNKSVTVSGYTIGGADAGNYTLSQPTGLSASITPASLAISGLSANSKVYDATTAATLSGTGSLSGVLGSDAVSLGGAASASFADKNVANNKAVTVNGYTISGADAGNYTLSQPGGLIANITAAGLSIGGLTANNKVYDATTVAALSGTGSLSGVLGSDAVLLGGTASASFADKNTANNKAVTVSGYTISGADAANYTLSQPTGLNANITAASLSVAGISAVNKIYDSTTAATLSGTATLFGKFAGDAVVLGGTGAGAFADKNVGTGKAVSISGYTVSGADAGNYVLAQPAGLSAAITAASLSVAGLSASNKVYDSTTAAALGGTAVLSGKYAGDSVTLGGAGSGAFADKNVANGKAVTVTGYTVSGADAGNYILAQPTGLTANITPANLLVTGLSAGSKVYDATMVAALSGTAALSGKYAGDAVTLGGAGAGAFADKNVANGKAVTVTGYTISGADAGNYALSQPTGLSANITAASLSVTGVSAVDKVYDATTIASLTGVAALSGKFAGDTVMLGGAGAGAFADKNVGTGKAVGVSGYTVSGADAGNYILAQPAGLTANITPASLNVTNISANNKVYDGTVAGSVSGTANLLGKKAGDTVVLSGAGAVYVFDDKNVGTGKTLNVSGYTISGTDAGNYTLSQPAGLSANITPLALTLSGIGVADKVYDATTVAALTGTAALNGKVSGDAVTLSGAGAVANFVDKNAGANKAVTVAGYAIGGLDAGNYTLSQPAGLTATVSQAALSLSGLGVSNKVYDSTTIATLTGTAALSGKFTGDAVVIGGTGSAAFGDKNVGVNKAVTVSGYTIGGADAANYSFSQPTGLAANITAASLSVMGLSANNKVYDSTVNASLSGTATLSGKYAGDSVAIGGTASAAFADKNVANGKTVTASGYTISGADAGNYTLGQPTGLIANITPAALSVAGLGTLDKTYDATVAATLSGTATLAGKYAGDGVVLGGTGSATFADKNVANGKSVSVSGYMVSGIDAGNYILAQPTGLTANITPAALTIAGLGAGDKIYDSTALATLTGTALLQGKMSGDNVSLGGVVSSVFSDKNVGTGKAVSVSGYTISGIDAANYALSQPTSITASITAATLSINGVMVNNRVYDATATATLGGTAALQGLFSGDLISLSTSGASASFSDKNVGNAKAVTVSGYGIGGTDAGNYILSQPTGLTANITPAGLSVSGISAANKVYDSTTVATLGGAAALSGLLAGDDVSLGGTASASFANKNVGTSKAVSVIGYNITGGDAGNYNFTQPVGLSANITPATLGIAGVSANDKVYDGTSAATLQVSGTTLTGKYAGDAVTLITGSVTGAFTDKEAGAGKTVLVSGFSIAGSDASNYTLLPAGSVTATITQKSLGVTGTFTAASKTYDGTQDAAIVDNALVLGGVVVGDTVTLNPVAAFADAAVGSNKIVSLSPLSTLGGAGGSNYTLLLTGAPTALANIISAKPAIGSDVTQTTTALFSTQPVFATTTASSTTTINTLASVSGNNPSEKIIIMPQSSSVPAASVSAPVPVASAPALPAAEHSRDPKQEHGCDDAGSATGTGSCN